MVEMVTIRFVALGDSLTVGFQSPSPFLPGGEEFPYTQILETIVYRELTKKGLNSVEVYLRNVGMLGDTTRSMLDRFDAHVAALKPDYVIVWGGINDLFMLVKPETVFDNLKKIYEKAQMVRATPIACTLTSLLEHDYLLPQVVELNNLIKGHCAEQGIRVADLFSATADDSGRLRETFSSDGVHLSQAGYQKVAYAVYYDAIEPILSRL